MKEAMTEPGSSVPEFDHTARSCESCDFEMQLGQQDRIKLVEAAKDLRSLADRSNRPSADMFLTGLASLVCPFRSHQQLKILHCASLRSTLSF